MAGEIKGFNSPSIAFKVKPAKTISYHEKLMPSTNEMISMENYLSGKVNEELLLNMLLSVENKAKALDYLLKHIHENHGILMFRDKQSLFEGFVSALIDDNDKVKSGCTKLISKIIPQLGGDLDDHMTKVLPRVIANVGSRTVSLQKESIQALHVYMKHSLDVYPILNSIAHDGMRHKDGRVRQQVIFSFPTLLFAEFKDEDFFDIVHSLVFNLTETLVDKEIVLHVLDKVSGFLRKDAFNEYINRLSSPLQHTYFNCCSASVDKLIDTSAPNRIALHSKHSESNHETDALSSSRSHYDIPEKHSNFKSDHLDSVKWQNASAYSNIPIDSKSNTPNSLINNNAQRYELSFIPQSILEQLSHPEHTIRLQAIKEFKDILQSLRDSDLIKDNVLPLMSLLQLVFNDKNFRVASGALKIVSVVISKVGSDLSKFLPLFVRFVSNRLGNVKDAVKSECYKVLFQIMEKVGQQQVLDFFWDKLSHKQYKVREDFLCFIIATLLSSYQSQKFDNLDLNEICKHVANCLTDSQPLVRRAALDCIAVLGYIMGTSNKAILSAVDKVELRHENASGIMSAVQARLLKQQLPRLNENMLVEYAVLPTSSAPVGSLQGADIQWILAAEKSRKPSSPKGLHSSHEAVKHLYKSDTVRSINSVSSNSKGPQQTRRHMSAGKSRHFPWASQEDLTNSKHPSSAPVNGAKVKTTRQAFQSKTGLGSSSEINSSNSTLNVFSSLSPVKSQSTKPLLGSGPSYLELHNRRKEAQINKSLSTFLPNHSNSRKDSGYEPSFASHDSSPSSSAFKIDPNSQAASALSNSCPSSFFENNPAARPRRVKSKLNQNVDTARSSVSSEDAASPIRLKPTLARSASKRRENTAAASRELLKTDDVSANIPVKLISTSASPRFDRFSSSNEQMRPLIKSSHSLMSGTEKFPGPSFDHISNHQSTASPTASYTPSSLQRANVKEAISKPEQSSPRLLDLELPAARSESFLNDDFSPESPRSHEITAAPRPIVSSNFSPARHRNSEELSENAVSLIRRSAQNKRERMRSQPSSEDAFNGSFTEYARDPIGIKATTSAMLNDDSDFYSSPRPMDSTSSSVATETPSFKYNPNMGKTFESKKTMDTDVSVIGVGYHGQTNSGLTSSGSNADVKTMQAANVSPLQIASSSIAVLPSKFSPSVTTPERNKSHRGSIQSTSNTAISSDPANRSFNIQGKGVFMTSANSPLLVNDASLTSAKDDTAHRSGSIDLSDAERIIDGVCGVAVRQKSLTPEDMSLPHQHSTTQVSLSASLKERKERQREALSRNKLAKTLTYGEAISSGYDYGQYRDITGRNDGRVKASKSSSSAGTLAQRSGYNSIPSKSGTATPVGLTPLDHPERSLVDTISDLTKADSEDWEIMTQGMYTIRRLAIHHPAVLSSRFHDVITLLVKFVPNLRSQVSKASVQAITEIYTYLKKPVVDTDLEATVRALLSEHGKSFIKSETSKALQAIVNVATSSKTLNALLNTGLKHKNKNVRNTAAQFCAELVDKMGPGKALSGIKDTTDRLLEALASFIADGSEDVRYYGRLIVNKLMNHEDFNRCLDKYLSPDNAKAVKNIANTITQRGLSPLSSFGSRKNGGSGRRRKTGSSPTSASGVERVLASTGSRGGRTCKTTKVFNEQEHEKLKTLCDELSEGNISERKEAILLLIEKMEVDRRFIEDNIVKIMSAYVTMLNTAQTKLNSMGLESLPDLIMNLHSSFKDVTPQLVPALLKLISSKQHSDMAQKNIELLVKYVEPAWIISPFATSAMYSGNPKAKQTAICTVTKLIGSVARKKPQIIERQVFPVLWSFLSSQNSVSSVQMRREVAGLARALHDVFGKRLFDYAESQNLTQSLKDVLGS